MEVDTHTHSHTHAAHPRRHSSDLGFFISIKAFSHIYVYITNRLFLTSTGILHILYGILGAIFVQAPEPATATEEEHEMMVLDHGMPADRSLVNSSHGIGLITRNPVEQPSTSSDTRQYGTAPRQVAPDNTGRTEVNGISESSEHETLPPSHSIEQVSGDLQSIPGGTHDVPDIARRTHAAAGRIDNVPEISHDPQPESWMGTTESGMLLCSPSDELDEYNPEHLPVIDSDRSLGGDGQSGVYVILDDGLPSSPASGLITTASEAERSGSIISDVRT